jgi:hypothetical protein
MLLEYMSVAPHRYGRDALLRDPAWHVSKVMTAKKFFNTGEEASRSQISLN